MTSNFHLQTSNFPRSGSSLMLVIASVLIVSMVVVAFSTFADARREDSIRAAKGFRARMIAESNLAIALHPEISAGDPLLRGTTPEGINFEVKILLEGGRFPINTAAGDDQPEVLTELFELWGVDPQNAAIAAESLADWIDEGNSPRDFGAEKDFYAGLGLEDLPRNEEFASLEELLQVRGMGAVDTAYPNWREAFTTHGDGLLDVNGISPQLIEAATGASPGEVEALLTIRHGSDGIPGTEDDRPFESLEEVQQNLRLPEEDWAKVEPFLTVEGSLLRIESTAEVGDHRHTIILLAERDEEGNYSYISRTER